ncbi:MAG: hypothetical protein MK171_03480 [Pirellulales bacterium]|nr:hypothetical protein [Pirellulales bacterium]
MTAGSHYQSFRAPPGDGEFLCVPPRESLPALLQENRQQHVSRVSNKCEWPLTALAAEARREALAAARRYTQSYAPMPANKDQQGPLVFTGHQPELVHPGVWLKNFAADALARQAGGIAVNLIIDSDLCRNASVQVPTGTYQEPRLTSVPFDEQQDELPYEERAIRDATLWPSFGQRVSETISSLVNGPLAPDFWRENAVPLRGTNNLGRSMAQARHRMERQWGAQNWELPQSLMCQTKSFRFFAISLWEDAQRFRAVYNDALAEYRDVHRLRSKVQPMPDLVKTDGWTETPFWIWTKSQPVRKALFVRQRQQQLQLSDLADWREGFPRTTGGNSEAAIQQLAAWEAEGTKIRTRALTTTLYARLLLADLFIHGIGGSKYDQVTDTISERFFDVRLPSYVTLSGTLRLPIKHPTLPQAHVQQLRAQLRALKYHPEKHLASAALDSDAKRQGEDWRAKKLAYVQCAKTSANAAERHRLIVGANAALQKSVAPLRRATEKRLVDAIEQIRVNQLLDSREYPFCLYPEQRLRHFLLDF